MPGSAGDDWVVVGQKSLISNADDAECDGLLEIPNLDGRLGGDVCTFVREESDPWVSAGVRSASRSAVERSASRSASESSTSKGFLLMLADMEMHLEVARQFIHAAMVVTTSTAQLLGRYSFTNGYPVT